MEIENKIIELYQQGTSIREISRDSILKLGEKYNCKNISNILKHRGIKLRSRSEDLRIIKSTLNINNSFIDENTIEWIDGLMLGDGGINFRKNYAGARICLSSSQKQWTEYGMSGLPQYKPSEPKIYSKISKKCPNPIWESRTLWHPDIAKQAMRWYPLSGKKTIVPNDVRITPISALLWYLGDGSITTTDNNCTFIRLATCSFLPECIENILMPRLKDLSISCHRCPSKNDICINTESLSKFMDFIGNKSPISCYDYKFNLPEWRRKIRLAKLFSTKQEIWKAMYYIKEGHVSSSRSPGGRFVLLNEEEASKLEELVRPKGVHIKDIVTTEEDRLRSRSLIVSGEIKAHKSIILESEVEKLKSILKSKKGTPIVDTDKINIEFEKYRKNGFPFFNFNDDTIEKKKRQLERYVPKLPNLWDGKNTELASLFFPHIFSCKKNGNMSAIDIFENDSYFKKAIERIFCLFGEVKDWHIRQLCGGRGRANNFPPRVAKSIIMKLSQGNPVSVLDPCCGFGGRLLGAMSCFNVSRYTGIDLSTATYEGNKKMIEKLGFSDRSEVHNGDCLELMKGMGKFDIILTSPPFWNVEEYIGVKVDKDYETWKKDFVEPLLSLTKEHLTDDGKAAYYLENIEGKNFIEDFIEIANSVGLEKNPSIKFKIPSNEYHRSKYGFRYVKVLVFQIRK